MRKILLSLGSLGIIILASTNVIACNNLNDLEKSFNSQYSVTLDNKEFTLSKLGLQEQGSRNIYDFIFQQLDQDTTKKIIKVKPKSPITQFYFDSTYPSQAPNKDSEIAALTGNNCVGENALKVNNNIILIPSLFLSLLTAESNPSSSTGYVYEYTGLVMNVKINVILN